MLAGSVDSLERPWSRRAAVLMALGTFCGLALLGSVDLDAAHYGPNTDELAYHQSSRLMVAFFQGLVREGPSYITPAHLEAHFRWNTATVVHPPLSRMLSALAWFISTQVVGVADDVRALRLHLPLGYALLGTVMMLWSARRHGWLAGWVTLLCYLACIRMAGHFHLATTDAPLCVAWVLSALAYAARDRRHRWSVLCGLLVGAALATKNTAAVLAVVLVVADVAMAPREGIRRACVVTPVALLAYVALHPALWLDPVGETAFDAYQLMRRRADGMAIPSAILGTRFGFDVPWWAHVYVLVAVTPVPALVLGLGGLVVAAGGARRRSRPGDVVLACAAAAPLLAMFLHDAPNHDLERLFLPVFPMMALLAGHAVPRILDRVMRVTSLPPARARSTVSAVLVLLCGTGPLELAASHPHELLYFSGVVGGMGGAHRSGTDVFLQFAEITTRVTEELGAEMFPGATVGASLPRKFLRAWQAQGWLRPDVTVTDRGDADFFVIYMRASALDRYEWEVLREGTPYRTWDVEGLPFLLLYRRAVAPVSQAAEPAWLRAPDPAIQKGN